MNYGRWGGYLVMGLCACTVAQAQTYRCQTASGTASYQATPCEPGKTGGTVKSLPAGESDKKPEDIARQRKQYYDQAMARHDYKLAQRFASSEKETRLAENGLRRCNELAIRRDEAVANAKGKSGQKQHAAEAAQARYAAECK